ncbi:MAG: AsmA-like C-terminal region-containing protein [Rhodospirillales bacterium]
MLMVVAWQLSSGPISLAFLSPYIENAVNSSQPNFKLKMKDTILTWAGWERTLDIRVLEVRILKPDGSLVGSIPEVSFSLSGKALVGGLLAPQSIELFGPRLLVRREFSGGFDVAFMDTETKSTDFAERLLAQLQAAPDPNNVMSYLTRVEVVSAEVTLEDQLLGKTWVTPSTHVSLRRDKEGIKGEVILELDVDGRQTEVNVSGVYQTALKRFVLTANFSEISPVAFSSMYYELGPLRAFALPLKGSVTAAVTLDGKVEWLGFNLTGGRGVLNLPDPVPQSLPVESVVLKGRFEGQESTLDVEELTLDLGPKGRLMLPPPANHPLPLSKISLKGHYLAATHRLIINELTADLQGPSAKLSAVVDGFPGLDGFTSDTKMSVDVKGEIRDVPADHLERYWPKAWGTDAYQWIVPHLSDGMLHLARADIRLWSGGGGKFELVSLDGDMEASGVTVDYLPPMPPVKNTEGYMKYNEKEFNIYLTKGESENLTLREGAILLSGLDEVDQYADITLFVEGSLGDQLAYMDHKPFEFASGFGIDPATTKGRAETKLKINFLMEKATTVDTIEISAKSKATGVSAAKAVLGRDINGGDLEIQVDKKRMDLTGTVNIGSIPASLVWRENFGAKKEFQRRYDIKAIIDHSRQVAEMGLDIAPFTDKFIQGPIGADVRFTIFDDVNRRLEVQTDITAAELSAPAFGWSKKPGVTGRASIVVDFEGDRISDVPRFIVAADNLQVLGRALYGKEGEGLQRIDFDRILFGRTDIKGALISRPEGGWDVGLHGPSFDMSALWEDIFQGRPEPENDKAFQLPFLTIAVELEKVWIGPDRTLKNISGTFAHKDDIWNTVLVKGEAGNKKSFELTIRPGPDGKRNFVLTSEDAGEALKIMDFYDNMLGGKLEIAGKYDDAAPGRPLIGRLRVRGYRVNKAPVLAHVLSLMALTGIVEALQGDGLAFTTLEIPFVLGQGALEIKNAKATGPSLGFTASGTLYTYADVVDVSGTVVPAYAINSALGHIPVLGDIFTGGEKGGGVFAVNYSMSGPTSKPTVTVNPLSALAPGIFRNVFDIFGQAEAPAEELDDTDAKPETN